MKITDIPPVNGLVYVASPYTGNVNEYMEWFLKTDAKLVELGFITISPLFKHFILSYTSLPSNWSYWKEYSYYLLNKSSALVVIMSHGWESSAGVSAEIEFAKKLNIPIFYIDHE